MVGFPCFCGGTDLWRVGTGRRACTQGWCRIVDTCAWDSSRETTLYRIHRARIRIHLGRNRKRSQQRMGRPDTCDRNGRACRSHDHGSYGRSALNGHKDGGGAWYGHRVSYDHDVLFYRLSWAS